MLNPLLSHLVRHLVNLMLTPLLKNAKVDIHVFNPYMNEILGEIGDSSKYVRNENPQNQEANFRSKINEEYNEDDDIPIDSIIKKII